MTEAVEQPETLPAASVAVALKVVEVSSETATVIPGDENAAAVDVELSEDQLAALNETFRPGVTAGDRYASMAEIER